MSKQTELAQVADTITVDSGNVGIGTSSPNSTLSLGTTSPQLTFVDSANTSSYSRILGTDGGSLYISADEGNAGSNSTIIFEVDTDEAMRIDSSGNLLVGRISSSGTAEGIRLLNDGCGGFHRDSAEVIQVDRKTDDGVLISFRKDGSTVGSIGVASGADFTISGVGTTSGIYFNANGLIPLLGGNLSDNTEDIGQPDFRWNDAYITNGVTTGSDGNDKQDIRDLTEAEQRVAVACKGLLKAWRWKSAVEEKGDNARIHCGIIAQDLQAAFAAEGLDAGRYAMFISNTWWETQTELPAVEAVAEVLDEDGNVVTEAVEAADAYTRTDTYDTQEEAPEGATERTRLGVRYSELLAFIIGAL